MDGENVAAQEPTTPEQAQVSEQPQETVAPEPEQEAVTPSWQELLERADARELRKHPKIAGLIGSELQRAVQDHERRQVAEQEKRVRDMTEQELLKFSEENADYLKANYPRAYEHIMGIQQQRAQAEVANLRGRTIGQLAEQIGRAFRDVPEWSELTTNDHEQIARAVIGKPDEEVIGIFNRMALDLVAEKRAQKKHADWKTKDLVKERDAIRLEESGKLLKGSDAPDTTRPKGAPGGLDIRGMSDEEFDKYYNQRFRR